jgi:hypothetical protein
MKTIKRGFVPGGFMDITKLEIGPVERLEEVDPNYALHPQSYIDEMLSKGFNMVYTTRKRLLLDLDTPEAIKRFYDNLHRFTWRYNVNRVTEWSSKSGNKHVVIELNDDMTDFMERLICQCYLGSDPTKEYLSMLRFTNSGGAVSFLAQPPGAKLTTKFYELDTRGYRWDT